MSNLADGFSTKDALSASIRWARPPDRTACHAPLESHATPRHRKDPASTNVLMRAAVTEVEGSAKVQEASTMLV